ncbi:MAG: tryptophan--tRNA ligase [Candidatus Marinimicrobia bacterium]|jgi:tryptophanyl-tRNA synthetase|nr:tryptophan--tRNA ligase [Candidatus Neomarinimicrobiota bacterium]MCK9559083.1 tryptophan--tRNA ligase [Candidatus Neomarinimicrobiota bacterium]MDD5540270.1 tryptophan--tRNA ligase [Candidatus Neomarinimicrobiota bacterium]
MEKRKVKGRILSGMRPTGKMHLGNYVGALENWVKLQQEYENYHLIADYHALTTNLDTSELFTNTIEMVCDWLAVGIDPQRSPIFRQSQIKEHSELCLIFGMLITTARLERNPTLKEQVRDLNIGTLVFGHLGYPVLQAADILLYKGNVVPVGEDQVPHVEITREIARKFNQTWGKVFPIPEAKLTSFARLPGLDGNKMSKSVGNTILLADSPDDIKAKIKKAVTDPQKIRRGDPGRPEICLVYTYHKKFNAEQCPEIYSGCTSGALGCVECKMKCGEAIYKVIEPYRNRRMYYASHQSEVLDIIIDGEKRARTVAQSTMTDVREKMKLG